VLIDMYVLQPIERIQLDYAIKLKDAYLIPFFRNPTEVSFSGDFSVEECNTVIEIVSVLRATFMSKVESCFIIYKYDVDVEIFRKSPQEQFYYTEQISIISNRYIDPVRIEQCNLNNIHMLPGRPGAYKNYLYCYFYDLDEGKPYEILGDVTTFYSKGIGLYIDDSSFTDFDWYFDDRTDIISGVCKVAYNRLSEAMYFENTESKLIYLTSTFETLASPSYLKFQYMRKRLCPFISNDMKEYLANTDWFKKLSDIRTEVVHNGKRLSEFMTKSNVKNLFYEMQGKLVNVIINIYDSGVHDFDEMYLKKVELYNKLK